MYLARNPIKHARSTPKIITQRCGCFSDKKYVWITKHVIKERLIGVRNIWLLLWRFCTNRPVIEFCAAGRDEVHINQLPLEHKTVCLSGLQVSDNKVLSIKLWVCYRMAISINIIYPWAISLKRCFNRDMTIFMFYVVCFRNPCHNSFVNPFVLSMSDTFKSKELAARTGFSLLFLFTVFWPS